MSDLIEKFLKLEETKSDNPFKTAKELDESVWRHVGQGAATIGAYGATMAATGNPVAAIPVAATVGQAAYHAGLKKDIKNAKKKYDSAKNEFGEDHPETMKAKQEHENMLKKQSSDPVFKVASKLKSILKKKP